MLPRSRPRRMQVSRRHPSRRSTTIDRQHAQRCGPDGRRAAMHIPPSRPGGAQQSTSRSIRPTWRVQVRLSSRRRPVRAAQSRQASPDAWLCRGAPPRGARASDAACNLQDNGLQSLRGRIGMAKGATNANPPRNHAAVASQPHGRPAGRAPRLTVFRSGEASTFLLRRAMTQGESAGPTRAYRTRRCSSSRQFRYLPALLTTQAPEPGSAHPMDFEQSHSQLVGSPGGKQDHTNEEPQNLIGLNRRQCWGAGARWAHGQGTVTVTNGNTSLAERHDHLEYNLGRWRTPPTVTARIRAGGRSYRPSVQPTRVEYIHRTGVDKQKHPAAGRRYSLGNAPTAPGAIRRASQARASSEDQFLRRAMRWSGYDWTSVADLVDPETAL